jgi:hypothetical protein
MPPVFAGGATGCVTRSTALRACFPWASFSSLVPLTGVETQVSMGAYRPYHKTLYWHLLQCGDFRTFRNPTHFTFFMFSHVFMHFAFSHVFTHFAFSHSHIFCALTCTTTHLPRIHCILFTCPVLILQGPLVRISLCFTHITSYMSLHSIYVHLSPYVFILHHHCTFSTTYLAPSPGNSLSMLTCQRIVGGFYCTSLLSLTH